MPSTDSRADMRGYWGLVGAQFLGAFNDNALRWFLVALAMKNVAREHHGWIIATASFLFLSPYVVVSMHAGSLADRFSKRRVLLVSKAAEAAIMTVCLVGLHLAGAFSGVLVTLLFTLLLLGIQAAYYSPAKFGVLPELLPESRLSWGNGIFEMTGVLAIILGSVCGAEFESLFEGRLHVAAAVFLAAALLGLASTALVPHLPPAVPAGAQHSNPLKDLFLHGGRLFRNRTLFVTLLSVVYLWAMGLLFQLNIALYAKQDLGMAEHETGRLMGIAAVGIGVGNIVAGYISGKTIEFGLVPIAALGIALSSVALCFSSASTVLSYALVGVLGFFAGLFIVPTHAYLQEESDREDKGGVWAATNCFQTLAMLLAAGLFVILERVVRLGPPQIFLVCGAGTFGMALVLFAKMPEPLGRMLVWTRSWLVASLRVEGVENVPVRGPVLFILNGPPRAQGYWLLRGTRRFVRFLLPADQIRGFVGRAVAGTLKAIPLSTPLDEAAIRHAASTILDALADGNSVCLFASDGSSGDGPQGDAGPARGANLPRAELARIIEASSATVLPACLRRDGRSRRFQLSFESPWDRATGASELLARLER